MEVGERYGPSRWIDVPQSRIDAFAEVTGDRQWIHVDPERAADGPFGSTVAHGYLTLSLIAGVASELVPATGRVAVNYGLNRVRFPAPVPTGSRVRVSFEVLALEPVPGGTQATLAATVEREGGDRPVCAAEVVFRYSD